MAPARMFASPNKMCYKGLSKCVLPQFVVEFVRCILLRVYKWQAVKVESYVIGGICYTLELKKTCKI